MLGADRRRIEWIDTARGLAMCMIVFGHCVPGGFLKQLVYTFHVPVFFFLSGFLFHEDKNPHFGYFLKKEWKKILLPYYGAGFLSILIYLLFGQIASERLGVSVRDGGFLLQMAGMLYGNCKTGYMKWNLPLWFLPCLFGVLVMAWEILWVVNRVKEEKRGLWLGGILCLLVPFGICVTDRWKISLLPLGLETSVRMLPFFLVGVMAERREKKKNSSQKELAIMILLCSIICIFCAENNRMVLYHRDQYDKEGFFYLGAISGICLIVFLGMMWKRCRLLSYVGQHTMVILLFHKFPILFCQVILSRVGNLLQRSNPVAGIFVTVFAILSCLLLEAVGKRWKQKFEKSRALGKSHPLTTEKGCNTISNQKR